MKLVVVSHKICWQSDDSVSGYATDGGFPMQMQAISELFSETRLIVPCHKKKAEPGTTALNGHAISVCPLPIPTGEGWRRKIAMISWFFKNGQIIFRELKQADAVHTPIPGDIGTVGMLLAMLLRKPLFVRHCGNWFVQQTLAERFWHWSMEQFAGGRNVMLATGGAQKPPSPRNSNVKWVFSTSLRKAEMADAAPRQLSDIGELRLVIACRQEERKGTDVVINSLPQILKAFPNATLDVIGSGSLLNKLKEQAVNLKLEEKITFHGKLEHSGVIAVMKKAHLFCFPTSASEGFPKVVLEALASGLPVITTKVSVLPQLISSGCGVLLDAPSADLLAAAVTEVYSDKAKYNQMSVKAIETAQQYSLERWRDSIGESLRSAWNVSSLSSKS